MVYDPDLAEISGQVEDEKKGREYRINGYLRNGRYDEPICHLTWELVLLQPLTLDNRGYITAWSLLQSYCSPSLVQTMIRVEGKLFALFSCSCFQTFCIQHTYEYYKRKLKQPLFYLRACRLCPSLLSPHHAKTHGDRYIIFVLNSDLVLGSVSYFNASDAEDALVLNESGLDGTLINVVLDPLGGLFDSAYAIELKNVRQLFSYAS